MYWTCCQCCVFRMWMVGYNIAIGLYVLDKWSVLVYSICDRTVRTGHVVSVICCVCGRYVLI